MIVVLFIAFVLGHFVWFVVSLFKDLQMRKSVSDLKRQNRRLEEELRTLRNMPVEDIGGPFENES